MINLGRDFRLLCLGQIISVVGDSCGSIALAWWILEKTGSPVTMSIILGPTMFVRIFMLPLFGPIGDKFSRKKLMAFADLLRGVLLAFIGIMAFANFFQVNILITAYVIIAIGSAIFTSVASSIVPQLVENKNIEKAFQQSRAIGSIGKIAGGIIGGILVSILGVPLAFLIDALSFFCFDYFSVTN